MLHIVIVSFNSAEVLGGLLDSLPAALENVPRYSVTVADNSSSDASVAVALRHGLAPKVLQVGFNAGYAAGINVAGDAFEETGDMLVINPDVRLTQGSVQAMLKCLAQRDVGVVAPRMQGEDGHLTLSIRREPSLVTAMSDALLGGPLASRLGWGEVVGHSAQYEQGGPVAWATGAILLISAEAQARVGKWDERYFLYSEEVDYQRRVREAGLSVVYAPEAMAMHIGGESNVNPTLYALLTANRIRYYGRSHGRAATALFRGAVLVGEAMRCAGGHTHRAAFKAALMSRRGVAQLVPSSRAAAMIVAED